MHPERPSVHCSTWAASGSTIGALVVCATRKSDTSHKGCMYVVGWRSFPFRGSCSSLACWTILASGEVVENRAGTSRPATYSCSTVELTSESNPSSMPDDESEEDEERLTLRKAERSGSSLSHWFSKVERPMLDDFLASGLMGLDRKRRVPRPDVVGVTGYT